MSRTTIDFGIDLGTTNSAIAVLQGITPQIIKNNDDRDITPSAVFVGEQGMHVGERAKSRLEVEKDADDVHIEFKRKMGTDHQYQFKTTGRIMRPEDLSAEVLKSLRADAQRTLDEEVEASVITVPAAFGQGQCAATIEAGKLAGFKQCPLLQEPVAAALAYGFQADVKKEYWLVFDFGGGTFDAAIMKAEDGTISVVNHGGNNRLGGSDIDWSVVEKHIVPQLTTRFKLPGFSRRDPKWRTAFAVLKRAAEDAKIQLSSRDEAVVECSFRDHTKTLVEFSCKLTRNELIAIAEPWIMQAVDICRHVIEEKKLSASAIEKVLLVGGPTKAPYFRKLLQSQIGIAIDHSLDPLTVVARGAAVFAGTQRIEKGASRKHQASEYHLELKYKPVGADADFTVFGKATPPSSASIEGVTIECVNQQSQWRSHKMAIKKDGGFSIRLLAEKGVENVFGVELRDSLGNRLAVEPDRITYRIIVAISEQPLCASIAVALASNEREVFFSKGDPYPATHTNREFRTVKTVRKGGTGDVLRIPVVEGNEEKADWNKKLGELVISGSQVRRDVPVGSEVEVTLSATGPGALTVKAYIPFLDEEFEARIEYDRKGPAVDELHQGLAAEARRLRDLVQKMKVATDTAVSELISSAPAASEIEALVEMAAADVDSADRAEEMIRQLRIHCDKADDLLKWPAQVAEAKKTLDDLDNLVEQHGNGQQRTRAAALRQEIDEVVAQKRAGRLEKKTDQVRNLYAEILFEQPGFWLSFFNDLVERQAEMTDETAALRLVNQGRQCIDHGKVQGLRSVVAQLLHLLPPAAAEEIQRAYGATLSK